MGDDFEILLAPSTCLILILADRRVLKMGRVTLKKKRIISALKHSLWPSSGLLKERSGDDQSLAAW